MKHDGSIQQVILVFAFQVCIETYVLRGSINSSSKIVKFASHISSLYFALAIMTKSGQMDDANRAMCYALRNPGKDGKPMKLRSIQKLVAQQHYFSKPRICHGVPWTGVVCDHRLNFGKSDVRFEFLDFRCFLIMNVDAWIACAGSGILGVVFRCSDYGTSVADLSFEILGFRFGNLELVSLVLKSKIRSPRCTV